MEKQMDNNMERGMKTGIEQGHLEVYCFLVAILLVIIYDILNHLHVRGSCHESFWSTHISFIIVDIRPSNN